MTQLHLLVTGSSGAFGRLVCEALSAESHIRLVAASRSPQKIADLQGPGTEIRRLDFDDAGSLEQGFAGIQGALIVSTDELTEPGRRQRQHQAALEAATKRGIAHVAYTSMPNPAKSFAIPFAVDHVAMETAMRESGIGYTSLRNSWYQENLLAYLPRVAASGVWYTSAGDGRIAYVARRDAAAIAATVLREATPLAEVDVAGPELLTVEQMAAIMRDVLDLPLRVEHVSVDQLPGALTKQGVNPEIIPVVLMTEANQLAGEFNVSADQCAALLGRPLESFADFLEAHAPLFPAGRNR